MSEGNSSVTLKIAAALYFIIAVTVFTVQFNSPPWYPPRDSMWWWIGGAVSVYSFYRFVTVLQKISGRR
jgi:tellurite resistance protein TehA-like permease